MKRTVKTLAVALVGAGFLAFAAAPAVCGDEFCAMGGMLIKAEVVKDKAIEWGKDRRYAVVAGADTDSWSVLTLSKSDDEIALLVTPGSVFFGVAGKAGREVDAKAVQKAFGKDFDELGEAVKKDMGDLWKADAVKIQGADISKLAKMAGLGTVEKDGDWKLTTSDCTGVELDVSALK